MASSSVGFPVTESPQKQLKAPVIRPHLPFRRISLPTAPSLVHRESVFSIASVDSLPEGDDELPPNPRAAVVVSPSLVRNGQQGRGGEGKAGVKGRPMSIESPRRRNRTRDSIARPPDDKRVERRRRIILEFYETEKAYVQGLDLIYEHFLSPIITSLETPEPLLNRSSLTSIFSNFIDIWNLHQSFLSALTTLLEPFISKPSPASTPEVPLPNLSLLLLAHFPYLSLYTPFVTSFAATITSLTELISPPTSSRPNPHYNAKFSAFLSKQEADPRCMHMRLRDWLLSIVQRCPRYLLLLKDLIGNTEKEDPEHAQLTAVHTLVSKITSSLNTSLHTHAQTLALLALQKSTPNLPFQLISPGRTLIKRGSLIQIERSDRPIEREFLLFSDCIIWLAPADQSSSSWDWSWSGSGNGSSNGISASQSSNNTPLAVSKVQAMERPPMIRSRSKSEAELPQLRDVDVKGSMDPSPSTPATPMKMVHRRSHYHVPPPPPPNMGKRNPSLDDRWVYKGRADLVDVEIVVGSALEDDRRFEILSPGGSFAVYAASEEERDEWTSEIRGAKAQLLISLNVTNPNSTLTSSSSTNHVRRVLRALPYHPSDERVATLRTSSSVDLLSSSGSPVTAKFGKLGGKKEKEKGKEKEKDKEKNKKRGISAERRRKVEHWVPPIWIPDSKTSSCMRCGRMFGWRRRRHHCRLCGRCVCSACSGRTFYITEAGNSKDEPMTKPARACDACYETIFPLVDPTAEPTPPAEEPDAEVDHERHNSDTITSLSHLPSWLSMPALPVQHKPKALMAIDLNSSHDISALDGGSRGDIGDEKERRARLRVKSHQRLRSYQDILEDFQEQARVVKRQKQAQEAGEEDDADGAEDEEEDNVDSDVFYSRSPSAVGSPLSSPRNQRREDTARRSKRFSLPAIALHTTSVTARTEIGSDTPPIPEDGTAVSVAGDMPSPARNKRFSLMLAGRNSHYLEDGSMAGSSGGVTKNASEDGGDMNLARGVAAAKLAELLKKAKTPGN